MYTVSITSISQSKVFIIFFPYINLIESISVEYNFFAPARWRGARRRRGEGAQGSAGAVEPGRHKCAKCFKYSTSSCFIQANLSS